MSWQGLNALFSKWCLSGRLRDHPAFAVSLTCCSPASCARPGYSSLPSGAQRPKEWVPSCSSPPSGGEEPTQELLPPQCPGPRGTQCLRETHVPCWRCQKCVCTPVDSILLCHLPSVPPRSWSQAEGEALSATVSFVPPGVTQGGLVLWGCTLPVLSLAQRQGGSPHSGPALTRKQRLDTD